MAFAMPLIAPGHNNANDLQRWDRLADCRFFGYGKFIQQEWNTSEGRELSGNQRFKRQGKPLAVWIFPILYEEDIKYIYDEFTNGEEDGYVTVNVYNRDEMRWFTANATLVLPAPDRNFDTELGYYTDVRIELRKLKEI